MGEYGLSWKSSLSNRSESQKNKKGKKGEKKTLHKI